MINQHEKINIVNLVLTFKCKKMKELIKPNVVEAKYHSLESLCENHCDRPSGRNCNKYCTGAGTSNESLENDDDILF
jgi:hypothetical protein